MLFSIHRVIHLGQMNRFVISKGGIFLILSFIAVISHGQNTQNNEQAICKKYNVPQIRWTCKRVADCERSKRILNTTHEHSCGSNRNIKKICCPERTNVTSNVTTVHRPKPPPRPTSPPKKNIVQIARRKCTEYEKARYVMKCVTGLIGEPTICRNEEDCGSDTDELVTEGYKAEEKQYPHMAMIGGGSNVSSITWFCGGTLISERFILSAAHCTNAGRENEVRWAALGLLNRYEMTPDKLNENVFEIIKLYNHPNYNEPKTNHDIALYQLKKAITFSPFIRPICLHTEYFIPSNLTDRSIISGWGADIIGYDVVDFLLWAPVTIFENDRCTEPFATDRFHFAKGFDGKNMICAGSLMDKKRDTCMGDSGGPVKYKRENCLYVQVGVTSFGDLNCGSGKPAIYTRVSAYLEWIVNTVWPNEK